MARHGYVYILANRRHGTLYIGVTSDLVRRVLEHRQGMGAAFARRYGTRRLVYAERHEHIADAIRREKAMKKWRRAWKIEAIERLNPAWRDLWTDIHNWT